MKNSNSAGDDGVNMLRTLVVKKNSLEYEILKLINQYNPNLRLVENITQYQEGDYCKYPK